MKAAIRSLDLEALDRSELPILIQRCLRKRTDEGLKPTAV